MCLGMRSIHLASALPLEHLYQTRASSLSHFLPPVIKQIRFERTRSTFLRHTLVAGCVTLVYPFNNYIHAVLFEQHHKYTFSVRWNQIQLVYGQTSLFIFILLEAEFSVSNHNNYYYVFISVLVSPLYFTHLLLSKIIHLSYNFR